MVVETKVSDISLLFAAIVETEADSLVFVAQEAQHVLLLSLEDAADWIDSNLPLPPNSESLTGGGRLPSPPSSFPAPTPVTSEPSPISLCRPSVDTLPTETNLSSLPRSPSPSRSLSLACPWAEDIDDRRLSQYSRHPNPRPRHSSLSRSRQSRRSASVSSLRDSPSLELESRSYEEEEEPSERFLGYVADLENPDHSSSATQESLPSSEVTTLLVSGIPPRYGRSEIQALFHDLGDSVRRIFPHPNKYLAFVDVETSAVDRCLSGLSRRSIEGYQIRCCLSTSDRLGSSHRRSDSRHLSPLSEPSRSTLHVAHLPPRYSEAQVAQLFHDIGVTPYEIRQATDRFRQTSFAFVDVKTPDVPHCNRCLDSIMLQGTRISCSLSKNPHPTRSSSRRALPEDEDPLQNQAYQTSSELTTLHVAGLPPQFNSTKLTQVFADIGVKLAGIRFQKSNFRTPFAFVEVKSNVADYCQQNFDGQDFEGYTMSCYRARSQTPGFLLPPPQLYSRDAPSRHLSRSYSTESPASLDPRLPDRSSTSTSKRSSKKSRSRSSLDGLSSHHDSTRQHDDRSRSRSPPPRKHRRERNEGRSGRSLESPFPLSMRTTEPKFRLMES